MKFNSLKNIRYSFLILGLIAHNQVQSSVDHHRQVQQVITIFQEFIDPTRNPNKPFKKYADEIIAVLRQNPQYHPVCDTLKQLADRRCNNPVEFLLKFRRYQSLLPSEVQDMFKNTTPQDQQRMVAIFRKRLTA
jgi:hypothetical protein